MQLHKKTKIKQRMDYTEIILAISEFVEILYFFFIISFCNESFFEKN